MAVTSGPAENRGSFGTNPNHLLKSTLTLFQPGKGGHIMNTVKGCPNQLLDRSNGPADKLLFSWVLLWGLQGFPFSGAPAYY